ncbi:MAG TPA: hypothetical protein VFV33_23165 [Gemmatimonadaceae bacterium]|nr:hypothetical protein [Gemmatimonadaceae bacterium]
MPTRSDAPGASFPDDPAGPEGTVGGADAVAKTTYGVGSGTEPEDRRRPGDGAPSPGGTGAGRLIALVVGIIAVGGAVYALAM